MFSEGSKSRLRETLQELARLGSPVDLAVAETKTARWIEIFQAGEIHSSQAFELPGGQIGYMAEITVTNLTSRSIFGVDVELRPPWDDDFFHWLQPRKGTYLNRFRKKEIFHFYQFPRTNIRFDYEDVINHQLIGDVNLPAKRPITGWLLAIGGRIPDNLQQGQWCRLPLVVHASDHSEYSTELELWTVRLSVGKVSKPPRPPIFEPPKPTTLREAAHTVRENELRENQPRPIENSKTENRRA